MEKKKLPPGIRQRANGRYEGRIKHNYRSYSVYADTITETKKKLAELKYRLEHGTFVEKSKITLDEWFSTWMEEYKKNSVKKGTYYNYWKYYAKIKMNSMIGLRTTWSMKNEITWKKSQKFGGVSFIIVGILMIIMNILFHPPISILLSLIIPVASLPFDIYYTYKVAKKYN